jgi:hypothetical protein
MMITAKPSADEDWMKRRLITVVSLGQVFGEISAVKVIEVQTSRERRRFAGKIGPGR